MTRYLAIFDLCSIKSQICYRQVLHGFQDHGKLDQDVLIVWLRVSAEMLGQRRRC
ncbi:hypothetical protein [Mesorhizobium sp. NZP2077]|uniref:hypothetical protein n=1 Tax=Mesorhizobium sp. NZP2077 TaxID=2483404 RepID=UPI001FEFFED0|nr:hypothetical protein [Mesorhizobium sp. NZP2077]